MNKALHKQLVHSYHHQLMSAWTAPTSRRLSTGSLTAPPQFASGSCRTASNSTLTSQRWSGLLGTPAQLRSAANITTIDVAGSTLPVASKLKSLGVTIDSNRRFDCHARNVAKACNFHTRALRYVHSLLTDDVAQTVACSIVASRLDYCNALLSGAPAATFDKLQLAQNNLATVVCQSRGSTDARPLLHSLHWLPVRQRVTYKLPVLTHKVRTTVTSCCYHALWPTMPGCVEGPLHFSAGVKENHTGQQHGVTKEASRSCQTTEIHSQHISAILQKYHRQGKWRSC